MGFSIGGLFKSLLPFLVQFIPGIGPMTSAAISGIGGMLLNDMGKPKTGLTADQINAEKSRQAGRQTALDEAMKSLGLIDEYKAAYEPANQRIMGSANNVLQSRGLSGAEYLDPVMEAVRASMPQQSNIDTNALRQQLSGFKVKGTDALPTLPSTPNRQLLDTFDPSAIANSVLGNMESGRRATYSRDIDQFAGAGFEDAFLNSQKGNADTIMQSILDSQYGTAQNQLNNARARGRLSGAGYTTALGKLGEQRTTGKSSLDTILGDIFNEQRADLGGIAREARTAAGGYTLGQNFSTDPYRSRIEADKTDFSGGLEGMLKSRVGGQNFFDPDSALQAGGVAQGAQNTARPMFAALAAKKKQESDQRGLGTQGVF